MLLVLPRRGGPGQTGPETSRLSGAHNGAMA